MRLPNLSAFNLRRSELLNFILAQGRKAMALSVLLTALVSLVSAPASAGSVSAATFGGKWAVITKAAAAANNPATAMVVVTPQNRLKLTVPKNMQAATGGDVLLSRTGPNVFSATAATGAEVSMTLVSPDKAQLQIRNQRSKKPGNFAVSLTRVIE